MQETVPDRDPFERLEALQAKVQEVFELGGWRSGAGFPTRVSNMLKRTCVDANWIRRRNLRVGCEDPGHWDWQAYLVRLNVFSCNILIKT